MINSPREVLVWEEYTWVRPIFGGQCSVADMVKLGKPRWEEAVVLAYLNWDA